MFQIIFYGALVALAACSVFYLLPKFKKAVFQLTDEGYRTVLFGFLLTSFVIVATAFAWGIFHYADITKLGTFGDFFGGVSNPILSFLTFVGLLITIVLQQDATKEARRDSYRQMFDSTFFQMLTLLNTVVSELEIVEDGNSVAKGKHCFTFAYQKFKGLYGGGNRSLPEIQQIGNAWASIYYPSTFPHYFRFVFNIVRTIHEARLDDEIKMQYVRLLRAQLSNDETAIIFYNCLTSYGLNFRPFVKTYELTDNLPPHLYLSAKHPAMIDRPPFNMDTIVVSNY